MADELYTYIDSTGIVVPNTDEQLSQVQTDFTDIWGGDLSLEPATPQGRLIEVNTTLRQQVLRANATVLNSFNVKYAVGSQLDALGSAVLVYRLYAQPTKTIGVVTGIANTIIPAGSQVQTAAGDIYESLANVTIPASGSASVYFQSVQTGAIPCVQNTMTTILTPVTGWETVNNPDPPIFGYETETDDAYRQRITYAQQQATGYNDSIKGVLAGVAGIVSSYFNENTTSQEIVDNGITLAPHSICVVVDGGLTQDIANALATAKDVGCGYTAISGQSITAQGYDSANDRYVSVTFNRPDYIDVAVQITVSTNLYQGTNLSSDVTNAILNWASNNVSEVEGLIVGNSVNTWEIASAVTVQIPTIKIVSVLAGKAGQSLSANGVEISNNECGQLISDNITVIIQ